LATSAFTTSSVNIDGELHMEGAAFSADTTSAMSSSTVNIAGDLYVDPESNVAVTTPR